MILELMKSRLNRGLEPHLYFFRDAHGHEVDIIYQDGHDLIPIEIKASRTFHSDFLKNVQFFQNLVGERAPKGYLIYSGDHEQRIGLINVLNYKKASSLIL